MSGSIVNLIIQLLAGAVGGNVAGGLLKQYSLGPLGNSIAGIIGGGLGGQLLSMLLAGGATGSSGLDIGSLVAQIAGGGVGGGVLMVIVGLIRQALGGQAARS
jgi:uncharacterized membrane protein YeaQ/YmgE (transglycosylase-associated protein family)